MMRQMLSTVKTDLAPYDLPRKTVPSIGLGFSGWDGKILELHLLNEALHVPNVLKESVLDIRFVGLTHSDQIQGDATAQGAHMGNDVSPQIARSGIAVKKKQRVTGAFINVVHPRAVNFHIVRWKRELC